MLVIDVILFTGYRCWKHNHELSRLIGSPRLPPHRSVMIFGIHRRWDLVNRGLKNGTQVSRRFAIGVNSD